MVLTGFTGLTTFGLQLGCGRAGTASGFTAVGWDRAGVALLDILTVALGTASVFTAAGRTPTDLLLDAEDLRVRDLVEEAWSLKNKGFSCSSFSASRSRAARLMLRVRFCVDALMSIWAARLRASICCSSRRALFASCSCFTRAICAACCCSSTSS